MVIDLIETSSENFTQKVFLKHSILNSFILFKFVIKDFFKSFLFNISSFSRYEFWSYLFANITTLFLIGSILVLIIFAMPSFRLFAEILFYIFLLISSFIFMRVYAGRLENVKEYVSYVPLLPNKHKIFNKLEKIFLNWFFCRLLFYTATILEIIFLSIYLFNNVFHSMQIIDIVDKIYSIKIIDFILFIIKAMGVVYFVLSVAPSVHRIDYLEKYNIEFYPISKYYTWYSKEYIMDYLSLLACFFVIISIGYVFFIGYSLILYISISIAIIIQSIALMFSGRFLSVFMGFFSLLLIIFINIFFSFQRFEILFLSDNVLYFIISYYKVIIAALFIGMFYFTTFDRDIIKMLTVISFFLSALLILEDTISFNGMIVYDAQSITIIFYAFIALISIFIFISRVAYNKGHYMPDAIYKDTLWNDFRISANFIQLKYVYLILYYSSVAMVIYSLFMWLIPFVFNVVDYSMFNSNILSAFMYVRYIMAFYIFLCLFLIFKSYNDVFPMFVISVAIISEIYILLFSSLDILLIDLRIYPVEYIYIFIYAIMFVIAVCLNRYNQYISFGFGLSFVLMILALFNVLFNISYKNNLIIYNIFFLILIISNTLVAIGSYSKMQKDNISDKELYAG